MNGVRAVGVRGHLPCRKPSSSKTLTGLQPPVIGGGPHRLIPHIPVVDQVLHQGVHVTCRGYSSIGALGSPLQAHRSQSPALSPSTHTCQLVVVQVLNRVGLAKARDTDLYTGGIGHTPRAAVVDNPGGGRTFSRPATKGQGEGAGAEGMAHTWYYRSSSLPQGVGTY